MNFWTKDNIYKIMQQLNDRELPFEKYKFSMENGELKKLGSGSSAVVYEAWRVGGKYEKVAIKVIGFDNRNTDSASFKTIVEAQKMLSLFENNIVKIYDSIEVRVLIKDECEVLDAIIVKDDKDNDSYNNYLLLQFIVMEIALPVLNKVPGRVELSLEALNICDEAEIMKFAYDIGNAIKNAHEMNLLHRDIKLENIFYDQKREHYKLGDFGIAKKMVNGMVSTVGFTNGYGAPEVVGKLGEKYDCTADIYSFGIVLYVLMNELKFPGANGYYSDKMQYMKGFVPERPSRGTDELARIVQKMISFDPDDRYQSMEEVLRELDNIDIGDEVKYKKEHANEYFVLGMLCSFIGAVMWKLTFTPKLELDFSTIMYLFFVLCICKGGFSLAGKRLFLADIITLFAGIYMAIDTGFAWWKLIALIFVAEIGNMLPLIVGGCALSMNITYLTVQNSTYDAAGLIQYRWIAVLCITLAAYFLYIRLILASEEKNVVGYILRGNSNWLFGILMYVFISLIGCCFMIDQQSSHKLLLDVLGLEKFLFMKSLRLELAGICGVGICLLGMVRERFIFKLNNRF